LQAHPPADALGAKLILLGAVMFILVIFSPLAVLVTLKKIEKFWLVALSAGFGELFTRRAVVVENAAIPLAAKSNEVNIVRKRSFIGWFGEFGLEHSLPCIDLPPTVYKSVLVYKICIIRH